MEKASSLRCRLGLHRWQELRRAEGHWYRQCRTCGATADIGEGGVGIAMAGFLAVATTMAGVIVVLTLHSLLGPILIVAGVLAVGRVAFVVGLDRVSAFLSTGTWRRNG